MPQYIIIPNLLLKLGKAQLKNDIAEEILTNSQKSHSYNLYPTIEAAKIALKSLHFGIAQHAGIIELDMLADELNGKRKYHHIAMSHASANFLIKANMDRVTKSIKSVYIKNLAIPAAHLEPKECEQEHINQLDKSILENHQQCLLTCPLELELAKIPSELLYLLFIDYKLFDFRLETWKDYDDREPQCVSRFFDVMLKIVFNYLNDPDREKPFITFDDVLKLHQSLSASRFRENEMQHCGHTRTTFNLLPYMPDTVTISGIKEMLMRIKEDKNSQGFMIGEHRRLNFISLFCVYFSSEIVDRSIACKDEHLKLPSMTPEMMNTKEYQLAINSMIETVFQKTYKKIASRIDISQEQAKQLVHDFFDNEKPFNKITEDEFYWNSLMHFFDDLSKKYNKTSSKAEYEFEIAYSRSHAMAAGAAFGVSTDISNYTDDELQQLSELIYQKLSNNAPINLLTPHPELAKEWALKAIDKYNDNIIKATSILEKIEIIDALTHELETLHLFYDVNLRTCETLKKMLLLANQLRLAIPYDPNCTDGYAKRERIKETLLGMARFNFVAEHANELLDKHRLLSEKDKTNEIDIFAQFNIAKLMTQVKSSDYSEFTNEFVQLLNENESLFTHTINKLIQQYEKNAQQDSSLFVRITDAPRKIVAALQNILNTKDFIQFNTEMLAISDGWFVKVPLKKVLDLFPQLANNKPDSMLISPQNQINIRNKIADDDPMLTSPVSPLHQGRANTSPTVSPKIK